MRTFSSHDHQTQVKCNLTPHLTIRLIGTAVSPKPMVKSQDSKYKVEIKTELSREKVFHCKPVPKAKCADKQQTTLGPNYLLANWNPEENFNTPPPPNI